MSPIKEKKDGKVFFFSTKLALRYITATVTATSRILSKAFYWRENNPVMGYDLRLSSAAGKKNNVTL